MGTAKLTSEPCVVSALCTRPDAGALALEDVPVGRDVARRVERHRGVHAGGVPSWGGGGLFSILYLCGEY